ncbi:unnamed protein product [Arabidopsis thaliana]|uniref:(thale cress) hypothetical protein n=1 Tax=Arabidopsis thaliana TaxID=3702 RepID=A0A7G2FLX5_ARATH|nr:unnamed protein product [Arabidopsis thaliana]
MAFLSKFGNILKQTTNKQLNAQVSLSSPSLFQAIRCMSSSKLFIGGMAYSMDEDSLREAFTKYGEVVDTRVILDRETGRSRGFGFVTFTSSEAASSAIQALDGRDLHGRVVKVNYANDRTSGGGAGGGYGSSGGFGSSGNTYGEGSSASAGAVGDYNGSSGYGSANTYGSSNGGFAGDSQFGGSPVGNSSQFGGDNTQFTAGGQFGGEDQFGSMEKSETKMEDGPIGGEFEDVAKRA